MDFKQLEAFVYVVKLKSFSKAAQRIYLTQPTISAHINSLEKELDTKLIERGAKYVYPTSREASCTSMPSKCSTCATMPAARSKTTTRS